jgi:hypothetical protein
MRTNRTPGEWADWCIAKNRIAEELKEYYRACTTGDLPPQKGSMKNFSKSKAIAPLPERRFPPPWSAEELDACFVVTDSGQKLAYVYFEENRAAARRRSY